jgi:hypothetical protein
MCDDGTALARMNPFTGQRLFMDYRQTYGIILKKMD